MKEFLKTLGDAKTKARKYKYQCLCPGCQMKSINSHLVQQHPYLESIAENGKLYQIIDNDLFKSIESGSMDLNSVKTFLLFSFRGEAY